MLLSSFPGNDSFPPPPLPLLPSLLTRRYSQAWAVQARQRRRFAGAGAEGPLTDCARHLEGAEGGRSGQEWDNGHGQGEQDPDVADLCATVLVAICNAGES